MMKKDSDFIGFYKTIEIHAEQEGFTIDCSADGQGTFSPTTTGVSKSVVARLFPFSTKQIQFIVEQANKYSVPLQPISCGKNWGYTDSTPSCDNSVVIDLSKKNKILQIDEVNKFAIIEPGVTQKQLSDALANTQLFMDCTGSSTHSSVVGNILERGFGHSPFGDRFGHSCSYEVVLGNGTILQTGSLAYNQLNVHKPDTCHTQRTAGPMVEGLFSQSNFGIVSKLCIWLMPRPQKILPFIALFKSHEDFLSAIEPISRLKSLGVANSTIHIGNSMRILSSNVSWQGITGIVPEEEINMQLTKLGIGQWVMSGGLYGTRTMVKVYKKELIKQLKASGDVKINFLEPQLIKKVSALLNRLPRNLLTTLKSQLEFAQGLIDIHTGKPSNLFLKGSYHLHPNGFPATFDEKLDIAKDGCGLIWVSPTTSANRQSVNQLLSMLKETFEAQGFHLYATLSFINDRSIAIICNPIFDVTNDNEISRAQKCTAIALKNCFDDGFPPYRVANAHWDLFYQQLTEEHQNLITAVKKQLDPNNIVSPGRYGIG